MTRRRQLLLTARRRTTVGLLATVLFCAAAGAAPPAALANGQAIVNAAASQAGVPYCWNGGNEHGPTHGSGGSGCAGSTVGFDCTGLAIYAVYQGTGISGLPHDGEGNLWAAKGTRINSESQLQPGDIVLFGGSFSSFEHSAIYAGGGMTWDADNFNVPVQQHSMSWIEHGLPFVGAVRFGGSGPGGLSVGDGSFVSHNGLVYRIAGGAPIYVSNWNAVGGAQTTTALSDSQFASLPQYPADGTVLDSSGGGVFIVAGGAPLYLSNWATIGGPKPGVGVDQAAIDNAGGGEPWNHLRSYPADGTLLDASGGGVFVVAGGAPLYLSNYAAIGGARPGVGVDEWDIDNTANPAAHLRSYPTDGTFLNTSAGHVYRVVGGAPFAVSSWSVFGGLQPYVTVDQWDVDNSANPAAHLNATPVNGTIIEGIPSHSYWSFNSARRSTTSPSAAAVAVDDFGLAVYPQASSGGGSGSTVGTVASGGSGGIAGGGSPGGPGGSVGSASGRSLSRLSCIVPRLRHVSLSQVRHALRSAHCQLGRVTRPLHLSRHHTLRVVSQSVRAQSSHPSGYRINIRVT